MNALKRMPVAAGILALCVVFALVFGCFRSVSGLRTQAEQIFFSGAGGDGIGVASDLSARRDAALNLVTVARRYLDPQDEEVTALEAAAMALDGADTIGEKARRNRELDRAAFALGDRLSRLELSQQDENYRAGLLAELSSRNATISHDPYNDAAQKYNEALNALPAGFFGKLLGLAPLELFR